MYCVFWVGFITGTAYCWELFVVAWKNGISEEDAFLSALETSLDLQAGVVNDVGDEESVDSESDTGYTSRASAGGGAGGSAGGHGNGAVGGTSGYSGYYGQTPTQDHGLRDGAMHSLYHDLDRRANGADDGLVQMEVGGVGDEIVGVDGVAWGTVALDEGHSWRLESGSLAQKRTKGVRWKWAPLRVALSSGGGDVPADFWESVVPETVVHVPESVRKAQEEADAAVADAEAAEAAVQSAAEAAIATEAVMASAADEADALLREFEAGLYNDVDGATAGTGAGTGANVDQAEMPPPYTSPPGAASSTSNRAMNGGFWTSGPSELAPDLEFWLQQGDGVGSNPATTTPAAAAAVDGGNHDFMATATVGARTDADAVVAAASAAASTAAKEMCVSTEPMTTVEQESMVSMLHDLGFSKTVAQRQLVSTGWDVEAAVDQLLAHTSSTSAALTRAYNNDADGDDVYSDGDGNVYSDGGGDGDGDGDGDADRAFALRLQGGGAAAKEAAATAKAAAEADRIFAEQLQREQEQQDKRETEIRRAKLQHEEQGSKKSMADSGYSLQRRPKKGKGRSAGGNAGSDAPPIFPAELELLLGMGFERSLAEQALAAAHGDVELALSHLF